MVLIVNLVMIKLLSLMTGHISGVVLISGKTTTIELLWDIFLYREIVFILRGGCKVGFNCTYKLQIYNDILEITFAYEVSPFRITMYTVSYLN